MTMRLNRSSARLAAVAKAQTDAAITGTVTTKCLFWGVVVYRDSGSAVGTVTVKDGVGTTIATYKVDEDNSRCHWSPQPRLF